MNQNLVSGSLTPSDFEAIRQSLQSIREKLPFLIDLSLQERRELVKLGTSSREFVSAALIAAKNHEASLPKNFDLAEMERDIALFHQLYDLHLQFSQLAELLDDTLLAVGSDALRASLEVYGVLKVTGVGGADDLLQKMAKRYRTSRKASPEVAPAQ